MGDKIPLDLMRLRNATRAYLSILRDMVPVLIAFNEAMRMPELSDDIWPETLLNCVRTSVLDGETPGTVASIADTLAHALGETAAG